MSDRLLSSPTRRMYYDQQPHHLQPQSHHAHPHPHDQRRASHHHSTHPDYYSSHPRSVDALPPTPTSAPYNAPFQQQQQQQQSTSSTSLPPSVQRPMHQLVPEQQLQLASIHRFTPSCSRCRQKKLKCDTNLPCNQCIAKGVHDDCRKDPRVPRGRKRPKLAPTSSSESRPDDELASLRKRVKELEEALLARQNTSQPSSPVSSVRRDKPAAALSSRKLGTSSRGSATTGPSELGYGSHSRERYSPAAPSFDSEDEEPGETEASLSVLEKLAASDPRVSEPGHGKAMHKQINSVVDAPMRKATPNAYFASPAALNERIEILMLAKRLVPEKHLVDVLIATFDLRCHNLVGRILHMPSAQRDIDFFTASTVEGLLTSPLDMYDLARYLMILRLGMRFYPWKGNVFTDDTTPEFVAINALKNRGDDVSLQWLNLAKRALAVERNFSLGSLVAIQTAILMILDGRDSPSYLRMLLRISIQTALDMGLHRLGEARPSGGEEIVQVESGVRIWWYLVVKDWCSAQREGAYTIHPSQMTTRKPLHTTDARLAEGRTDEISRDEWCETSYTLCQIELANIIRESIDLRNEQSTLGGVYDVISPNNQKLLHVKLETFLGDLPPFYRLNSTEMRPGVLAVQRCLLHQQAFDVLLKLNRKSLSSYSERATCTLLAEQIVSTQKLLRSVCPVIDGFWVNFLHLFGATLTLTISLLLDAGEALDDEVRRRRRGVVEGALVTMRETPGSDVGSRIIEMLLEEEAKRCKLDLPTLTRRIVAQVSPGEGRVWESTPDESVVPAFAGGWGILALDVTDPMGWIGVDEEAYQSRPYEHSLRPWQEPSRAVNGAAMGGEMENGLWDWVFSQAALVGGPPAPIEGPPNATRVVADGSALPPVQVGAAAGGCNPPPAPAANGARHWP